MMTIALATFGGPSYFNPQSGIPSSPDYRGGLFREMAEKLRHMLKGVSGSIADFNPLVAHWDYLSGSARFEAFLQQFEVIDQLCAAPRNWSHAAAEAPSAEQAQAARRGLVLLFLAGLPAPKLMLVEEGTLGAYWRKGEAYASIDFDADGEYPWTAGVRGALCSGTWTGGLLPAPFRDAIGA